MKPTRFAHRRYVLFIQIRKGTRRYQRDCESLAYGVVEQAKALHQSLTIGDREWHKLKSNADRRGAELLAAALTQLLQDGEKRDVEAMTEQALGWIRRELKDPGCPHR